MNAIAWKILTFLGGRCDGRLGRIVCDKSRGHGGRCTRSAWPRVEWDREASK